MFCLICIHNRSLYDVNTFNSFAEAKAQMTFEFYYRLSEIYGADIMKEEDRGNEYDMCDTEAWMGQTGDEIVLDWYIAEIFPGCDQCLSTGNVVNYCQAFCPEKNAFVKVDCGGGLCFGLPK